MVFIFVSGLDPCVAGRMRRSVTSGATRAARMLNGRRLERRCGG
jgi:hypothetical protein